MYTLYMALHITNPEVEQQVRQLARDRGQSITDLIGTAVAHLRLRGGPTPKPKPTVKEMLALINSVAPEPIDYSQTEDEILGYGPHGLPG